MKLVYLKNDEMFINSFYTYEEAVDLFGEPDDYELENYYKEIPDDLYEEFINTKNKILALSNRLANFKSKS